MSRGGDRQLTTTGYAILCLLAIRPWSTYELAKQMGRTLHHIWPRAESNVYAEPKRLVEAGLARAESQRVGERPRTVYAITEEGRRAVEQWLATESAPSRFESEALVKVLFGNYGSKEQLLATLRSIAAEARDAMDLWQAVAHDYDRGTHWFPERVHVNSLIFRWGMEQAETNARWAAWAVGEVESWPDVAAPADVEAALAVFRDALHPDDQHEPRRNRRRRTPPRA